MVASIADLLSGLDFNLKLSAPTAKALLFIIQCNAHRIVNSDGEARRIESTFF